MTRKKFERRAASVELVELSSIRPGQGVDEDSEPRTLGLVTLSRSELDAAVARLDREWIAARDGDEELPPPVVDAIARALLPRERTRRRMPRADASAVPR
jgi:hypothetical protein